MVNFRSINKTHIKTILSNYQQITNQFQVRKPFDSFLRQYFYNHKDLGASERAIISQGAFQLIRHHYLLSFLVRDQNPKYEWDNKIKILEDDQGFEKALNNQSIPFLFNLIAKKYGEEKAFKFFQASNEKPPLTIRVNALKTTRDEFLKNTNLLFKKTELSPYGVQLSNRHQVNLMETPEYRSGLFEIQDEASQLCALRVQCEPKQKVLDYCAGSGGKTLAYAPQMKVNNSGVIHLYDKNEKSLEKARIRLKRAGIQNYMMFESHLKYQYDWIVLDVPCSGIGTLRRNPDLKLFLNNEKLEKLIFLQKEIFDKVVSRMRKDGKIVYISCSFLGEENEEQIKYFCQRYGLTVYKDSFFQSLPSNGGMDAFFSATLVQK